MYGCSHSIVIGKMAEYLVSTTLKCLDGHASRLFDELMDKHQVGGLFITSGEGEVISDVLYRGRDFVQIPCRIREVTAYFATLAPRRKLEAEEMFNICRFSLGFSLEKLKELRKAFFAKHAEDPETLHSLPIFQFLAYIIKTAQVKDEQFIIDNCFTLTYCREHECCKLFHSEGNKAKKPCRLCCCNEESCSEFANFHVMMAKRKPEAIVKNMILVVD